MPKLTLERWALVPCQQHTQVVAVVSTPKSRKAGGTQYVVCLKWRDKSRHFARAVYLPLADLQDVRKDEARFKRAQAAWAATMEVQRIISTIADGRGHTIKRVMDQINERDRDAHTD